MLCKVSHCEDIFWPMPGQFSPPRRNEAIINWASSAVLCCKSAVLAQLVLIRCHNNESESESEASASLIVSHGQVLYTLWHHVVTHVVLLVENERSSIVY